MDARETARSVGEVAPGVFCIEQSMLDGKNGVVVGSRAGLAIDSGDTAADGAAVADLIRACGREPVRLALTHGHGDHVVGSSAFQGAEVFAHARTPAVMRRHLPRLAQHRDRPNLAAELAWPTVTFAGELTIDLGGKTVRLVPAPGHSEDGVYAYVVEDRVLFSGDTAVTAITPVISDGDSRVLERSLRRMSELGAETLVPGHGPVVRGRDEVRRRLLWAAAYLRAIRVQVRDLLGRGAQPAAIVDACGYDQFAGDHPDGPRQRAEKPHQLTVAKIVAEVQEELGQVR
jgi:glyoxylase-like metal-dependent hydrolase (beta-lactamase superfamily II)